MVPAPVRDAVVTVDNEKASVHRTPARLLSAENAAQYLGIGTTLFATLGLPSIRIGRRVLYDRIDLDRWVDDHKSRGRAIKEETWPENEDSIEGKTHHTGGSTSSSRTDAAYAEALGVNP